MTANAALTTIKRWTVRALLGVALCLALMGTACVGGPRATETDAFADSEPLFFGVIWGAGLLGVLLCRTFLVPWARRVCDALALGLPAGLSAWHLATYPHCEDAAGCLITPERADYLHWAIFCAVALAVLWGLERLAQHWPDPARRAVRLALGGLLGLWVLGIAAFVVLFFLAVPGLL